MDDHTPENYFGKAGPNVTVISQPIGGITPETIARIAEFLALTQTLDPTGPADVEDARRQMIALAHSLKRELDDGRAALIREQIAELQRREALMLIAIEKAAPRFLRVNQLALHLAMELTPGLWRAVTRSTLPDQNLYQAVDAVRDTLGMEPIPGPDQFAAAPRFARPQQP